MAQLSGTVQKPRIVGGGSLVIQDSRTSGAGRRRHLHL